MAVDFVLEHTRQADLQPLVANGVPVFRIFGQIRIELQRALSREHVELFADPNSDPATGDIVWYAPFRGETVKLADCNEADRSKIEFHLARLVEDISGHIETLNRAGTEQARAMAHVLEMALEVPDESHIFVVANRPVLAGWGHVPRGPAAPIKILSALAKRALAVRQPAPPAPAALPMEAPVPPPDPAPPLSASPDAGEDLTPAAVPDPEPKVEHAQLRAPIPVEGSTILVRRLRWLSPALWCILTALLLFIGDLLLRYCGLGWPLSLNNGLGIVNYCEISQSAASSSGRNAELLTQLNDVQRALNAKRTQCAGPDSSTKRVEEAHGKIGALNVILTWNTEDDLDLHVTCPSGEEIYYREKTHCGGELDVDQNAGGARTNTPVENVTWPTGAAPNGTYKVEVDPFVMKASGEQSIDFTVELRIDNVKVEEHKQSINKSQGRTHVFDFTMPYLPRRQ